MTHAVTGSSRIYQFNELLYDVGVTERQIRFEVRITLPNNRNNIPPTPVTPLLSQRLTPKRSIRRPNGLNARKVTVCYPNSTVTVYIPYRNNDSNHNAQIQEIYIYSSNILALEYDGEYWLNNIIR